MTTVVSESREAINDINYLKHISSPSLEAEMRKFWELEEIPRENIMAPEEEQCEQHFVATHTRRSDGRYVVRLPFRHGPPISLGNSRTRAERLLDTLHRKFQTNPSLLKEYSEFLAEYESNGHMKEVPNTVSSNSQEHYLPHHPIIKESSVTTHLRVVFNASSITSNGSSLNEHMLSGPKLQLDLSSVIMQWRQYRYVYSADIRKMYRQIMVDDRDVNYQRILWKATPRDPIRVFQLTTVTYGTASAPYLALRVLKQLVHDDGDKYPLASSILQTNIYVDDILFGDNDVSILQEKRKQLNSLLAGGGFTLHKWTSNSADLLKDYEVNNGDADRIKPFSPDDSIKILGLRWDAGEDCFRFQVQTETSVPCTKRMILSAIARLYDPLGLVTPVIIAAKIIIQQMWILKVEWDEIISANSLIRWREIYSHLPALNSLSIARWTGQVTTTTRTEIHGFADASSSAYAAAVYLRVMTESGNIRITLLAGRSRVAPIKPTSIPRLELSAAVLLARLIPAVKETIKSPVDSCVCWTDSTVVLAWLRKHPSTWKPFVANRLAEIHSHLSEVPWRHVPTGDNPADCASRGLLADELISHSLWWHGPAWLSKAELHWPTQLTQEKDNTSSECEVKRVVVHLIKDQPQWELATRYSSWSKLIRITAYLKRFVRKCRAKGNSQSVQSHISIAVSVSEYQDALKFWLKYIQSEKFDAEIHALESGTPIEKTSSLLSLNPFLDGEGLLRVGGRIQKATIPFAQKHPVILASHPLVTLLISHTHIRMLHAGSQLMLSNLRREYWIVRARIIIRSVVHRCVRCARERAAIPHQLMGSLPSPRVTTPTKPFNHCGVDYAGPMIVRASSRRGLRPDKAYIAVFVCLATKAVHLELVGGYSASAYLDAFSRFCARRGLPQEMYSDNGTNFVGADRELRSAYRKAIGNPDFLSKLASDSIMWHFIPPSAPHFGGLWEAGVRGLKYHLRRVLGCHSLTYEEFSTLLCRIEACMNSRPIAPLTASVDDCDFLTPGHFLIGAHLTVPPEPSLLHLTEQRLSRWQLLRQLTERFWNLWRSDYVNSLQQRGKWRTIQQSVRPGQLVLVRNNLLPPCKWELGRIKQCHPGVDGLTRVVTLKTATSEYKRPIVKLCLLPVDMDALTCPAENN